MAVNITMPALSPTMEEGNLAKWLVAEGDSISPGDIIAEIETDKATMEVEAVDEGIMAKIMVPGGTENVKVNAVIAVLAIDGEDIDAAIGSAQNADAAPAETPAPAAPAQTDAPVAAVADAPAPAKPSDGARVFSSPLARRIAKMNDLDIALISGTGPHQRVIKRDVEKALADGVGKPVAESAPAADAKPALSVPPSDEKVLKLFADDSYDLVPHDNMRKIIASRLVESKQTVPHFYLSMDCKIDALLKLRSQMNASAPIVDEKPAFKISVNDMVIKALALGLRDNPDSNVSWTEANMVRHKNSDVGVAVSIPGGLITPIVKKAEQKTISAISNEMKDLAARAKTRKLAPDEYQGGSTAVSNLGMFGIQNFSAVINPPQATILAVGGGEKRPVERDGEIVLATVMSVTLSTDHRAVDGVLGAQLLASFKQYIENPLSMIV